MADKSEKGMPIYLDPTSRKIVSTGDASNKIDVWYPSNIVARRLWGCLEILRDINDLLEDGAYAKNSGKRKRKAKILAGYIHSLAKSVDKLCASIIGEREVDKDQIKEVVKIRKEFSEFVPFQWNSELSSYRNKLVAHFDEKFWPLEATELLNSIATHKIGNWLHVCLHVLLDLTKLDIYSWSCNSDHENYIRLMHNEPFITTMEVDNETGSIKALVGVDIANESPRNTVAEIVGIAIELSQWMFKRNQQRIKGLKEDSRDKWNTFSRDNKMYKDV